MTNIIAIETATSVLNIMGSYDNYSTLLGDINGEAMEAMSDIVNMVDTIIRLIDTILYKLMNFIREKRGITKIKVSREEDTRIRESIVWAKYDNERINGREHTDALKDIKKENKDKDDNIFVPAATYIGYLKQCEGELKRAKTTLKGLSVRKDSDANTEADKRKIRIYRFNISRINELMCEIMRVISRAAYYGYEETVNAVKMIAKTIPLTRTRI